MRFELITTVFGASALTVTIVVAFVVRLFTVEQRTTTTVQRLGKFVRQTGVGVPVKIPFFDRVIGGVDPRLERLNLEIKSRTQDNVFVLIVIAVQYYFLPDKFYDVLYKLENANRQITSFVIDVVQAEMSKIVFDDLLEKKGRVAYIVKSELARVTKGFGYGILKTLEMQISPDSNVKEPK